NMLIWKRELWLIDFGASLYFHHSWDGWEEKAKTPFDLIKDHVLLNLATELSKIDAEFKSKITPEILNSIVNLIPDEWLDWRDTELSPEEIRMVYFKFLSIRLDNSHIFVKAAEDARV
ncbi:MAG: aminotransferase class I and II, partial [Chryseobacterium sp.]|nr:aminotransferase class I and II [Chryseobacterium sp.]